MQKAINKHRWDIKKLFISIDENLNGYLKNIDASIIEDYTLAERADIAREVIYNLVKRTRDINSVLSYTREFHNVLSRMSYTHRLDMEPYIWSHGLQPSGSHLIPYKNNFIKKPEIPDQRYIDKMDLLNTVFYLYKERMETAFKFHIWNRVHNPNGLERKKVVRKRLEGKIRLFKQAERENCDDYANVCLDEPRHGL